MDGITEAYISKRLMKIQTRRVSIREQKAALEKECELMDQEEYELMKLQEQLKEVQQA